MATLQSTVGIQAETNEDGAQVVGERCIEIKQRIPEAHEEVRQPAGIPQTGS